MKRMGVALSPYGAALAARPVEVRNNATGALVTTGATDSNGRWEFDLADEAVAYKIEVGLGGASPQKVVQAPASIELEYLYVRYGATLPADTTLGGVVLDPDAPPGGGALDPRYVQKTGDTMSGYLTFWDDASVGGSAYAMNAAGGAFGQFTVAAARGNTTTPAASADLDVLGRYAFDRYADGAWRRAGQLEFVAIGAPAANNWGGRFRLSTARTGQATLAARYDVQSDGSNLFYGPVRSAAATDGPAAGLTVDGPGPTALGGTLGVAGLATLAAGALVQRPSLPTHGLLYFGSASQYLLWDASRMTVQAMPVTVAPSGAAALSGGLSLTGSIASDVSMQVNNAGVAQGAWLFGVEGSRAAVGPAGGLFINNQSTGSLTTIRPDGRWAFGQIAAGGASAQVDVQSFSSAASSFRALSRGDHPNTFAFAQFTREDGAIMLGATRTRLVSDLAFDVTAVQTPLRVIAVFFNNGTIAGYIPLYRTYS